MKTYARPIDGVAVEIYTPPVDAASGQQHAIADCFHADVAAMFRECPAGTVVGAVVDANGTWTAPAATPVAAPRLASLTPMQFYLAFTPAERIAIKASTDAVVKEFWATYELAVQTNTPIDPNLVSVQEGLAYLAAPTTATPPGAGLLAGTQRISQILSGLAQ
jgi:hypothetical protein